MTGKGWRDHVCVVGAEEPVGRMEETPAKVETPTRVGVRRG